MELVISFYLLILIWIHSQYIVNKLGVLLLDLDGKFLRNFREISLKFIRVPTYYGAQNLQASSNIIFSNGELDPWRGGGVQQNITGIW